jgi:hypothetical protein
MNTANGLVGFAVFCRRAKLGDSTLGWFCHPSATHSIFQDFFYPNICYSYTHSLLGHASAGCLSPQDCASFLVSGSSKENIVIRTYIRLGLIKTAETTNRFSCSFVSTYATGGCHIFVNSGNARTVLPTIQLWDLASIYITSWDAEWRTLGQLEVFSDYLVV